jgi:dynein heavy chain
LIDQHGWYNRKELTFKTIIDVNLLAAMAPPGGGRTAVTPRLAHHFARFVMPDFDPTTLTQVFTTLTTWIFGKFTLQIKRMSDAIVETAIHIYSTISDQLRPTPAKSHYTFNLRDLSKVFQGISQANGESIQDPDTIIRLVAHECNRVFADRLMGSDDQTWFKNLLQDTILKTFKRNYNEMMAARSNFNVFGDFSNDFKYIEVPSFPDLNKILLDQLEEYNNSPENTPMNLVLFQQAIEHVARILRVVRLPKGHCLLIGVGGSGRKSLARLAVNIADYKLFMITPTKLYNRESWRVRLYIYIYIFEKKMMFLFVVNRRILRISFDLLVLIKNIVYFLLVMTN